MASPPIQSRAALIASRLPVFGFLLQHPGRVFPEPYNVLAILGFTGCQKGISPRQGVGGFNAIYALMMSIFYLIHALPYGSIVAPGMAKRSRAYRFKGRLDFWNKVRKAQLFQPVKEMWLPGLQ
jgi:hypothetical protein